MRLNITEKFQWLLGVWKTKDGRSIYEEWWKPDENLLEGFRYELKHGVKKSQEKFKLMHRDGEIYYSIIGSKITGPLRLKMNFFDEGMAVFENPATTFPKFIRYKLKPENLLDVITEGERQNGTKFRIQYPFEKLS